ncbi:hypothetical protein CCACVL1_15856 [Corchorus capsularis]|uniref:Uncharacterized protein n=1 Tax=Corchorus capsularis TaxID=210143 RepID=A0A1R3I0Q4_COCAP|nr:hypothetical protein CCACVL1_15856 [Corchorus capsularis]
MDWNGGEDNETTRQTKKTTSISLLLYVVLGCVAVICHVNRILCRRWNHLIQGVDTGLGPKFGRPARASSAQVGSVNARPAYNPSINSCALGYSGLYWPAGSSLGYSLRCGIYIYK